MRVLLSLLLVAFIMSPATAADPVQLYAAGSLRAALTDVCKAFQDRSGVPVQAKYGPSGVLKDEIAGGAGAHVFASANMEHPRALSDAGKSGPVTRFARNRLCALIRPGLVVTSATLLEQMLKTDVKLASSTPKADPSGDYAFEVFRKAEAVRPGARAVLEGKALQLTGSPSSAAAPAGRSAYGWHVAEGRADIFLAYCTAVREALQQNPDQQRLELPDALAVGADYGLTVVQPAPPSAKRFADYLLSADGQKILVGHGFAPGRD